MKQLQQKNQQNIDLLSADFQIRQEPNYAWRSACSMFLALPGLRGFWPMSSVDYTAANRGIDLSEQGNHLTDNNTVEFGHDSLAPYVHFTRANTEYLSRADGGAGNWADILGTETYIESAYRGLTVGGWFYFDSIPGTMGLITKYNTVGNQRSYFLNYSGPFGTINFRVSQNGTAATEVSVQSSVAETTGQWYFIVGRFNPSTELKIWVNSNEDTNAVGIPASIFDSTADFNIGAFNNGTGGLFDGRASMCFLCATQLSDAIVLSLFEQTRAMYGV